MLALIPAFPLIGFLINGCWYAFGQAPAGRKKAGATVPGVIGSLAIFASFVVSAMVFFHLWGMEGEHRVVEQNIFDWISVGKLSIPATLRVDSLSTLFTLVITGVGTLIHVYSIGYMSHDETPGKFFCYLNLFCFAMLVLVMGASLPLLFLGWEGVGLCSYLLIGYWYTDIEKAKAGKKAFVVNRIGDCGFLLGMFMIFHTFGTLDFMGIREVVVSGAHAAIMPDMGTITAICLLLFVGCMGKSAQIPLYIWLPDAMAGPTPVSALIHAATMVTSGIYLIARLNFLYNLSPTALNVVAAVGVFTAFFASTIAVAQKDIKKILAYSTVSQLGYMFLGCGVGAYAAGVFHVITHAFFKALLFLGAGSVIHGMHEEQDIWKMGGLSKKMPQTFLTFAVGWLAISGIPPLSGFFSKDEILWKSFASAHGSSLFWAVGLVTAVLTAFYMTRLVSLTFLGQPRFDEKQMMAPAGHSKEPDHADPHGPSHGGGHHQEHGAHAGVHESPLMMTVPLMILAALSAIGGFIGIPHYSALERWLEPVMGGPEVIRPGVEGGMEWALMAISVIAAIGGIIIGLKLYSNLGRVKALEKSYATLHKLLENKWYVDEIFEAIFVKPFRAAFEFFWKGFDVGVIDRIVVGFGRVSAWTGQTVRAVQTGSIQVYAAMIVVGLLLTVGYLIYGMA